jgi:hypothetical protein
MAAPSLAALDLRPGDNLIYRPCSPFGYLIAIKTWHWNASHCEMYAGNGSSFAARGSGINSYPLRLQNLSYVLRPEPPFDFFKAEHWFYNNAKGQGYDYLGVFSVFTTIAKHGNPRRQWCSELLTRLDRAGGINPFSDLTDADTVAPFQLLNSSRLQCVWNDGRDLRAKYLLTVKA